MARTYTSLGGLTAELILEQTEQDGDCLLWTGWCNDKGYPYIAFEGRDQPVYRVLYQLVVGPIPEGLELDHTCVRPRCINPAHMEPVTHAENQRRMGERQTKCRRAGHDWNDPNNVRTRPNGRRYCAECDRIACRAYYHRRKEAGMQC